MQIVCCHCISQAFINRFDGRFLNQKKKKKERKKEEKLRLWFTLNLTVSTDVIKMHLRVLIMDDKIFKLQKWAVRTISYSHYRSHSAPLFKSLNILNVYDTYKLEVGIFMYRRYTNQLPNGFHHSFLKQAECHKYTRNANDYT